MKHYSVELETLLSKIKSVATKEAQDKEDAKNEALVVLIQSAKEARSLYPQIKSCRDGNFLEKILFVADLNE